MTEHTDTNERFPARIGTHYESCWKDHPECAYYLGVQATVERIAAWLETTGDAWRPISESRAVKCEHGSFGWEDCGECSIQQAADAIRRGDWRASGEGDTLLRDQHGSSA